MLIQDEQLRVELRKILTTQKRNQVVKDVKVKHKKFQANQIISFLAGNDVSLSTLKKIDEYVSKK